MSTQVDVKAAIAALRRYGDEAKDEIKKVNLEAARLVEKEAKQRVPVQTGRLRASIRSSGQAGKGVVRAGNARVPYANPIHWGWPSRPAAKWGTPGRAVGGPISENRFLTDALESERRRIVGLYRDELERLARKYG